MGGNVNGDTFSQLSIYCIATKAIENSIYRYLEYIVLIYNIYMYRVSQYHTTKELSWFSCLDNVALSTGVIGEVVTKQHESLYK